MDNLFYSRDEEDEDVENVRKINLDDLYDKKKEKDLQKLQIFNRILNRVHEKIRRQFLKMGGLIGNQIRIIPEFPHEIS